MNKATKILLLIMVVSLSALIMPLKAYGKNVETKSAIPQLLTAENAKIQIKQIVDAVENELKPINFEFYVYVLASYIDYFFI